MRISDKFHWDKIYNTKTSEQFSWTQNVPVTSLDFIHSFPLQKSAKIIDVGGGESRLVDYLLEEGYENITVLDISAKALDNVKTRLGEKAKKINWVVEDVMMFQPDSDYDVWHDRATFHFLTQDRQIKQYFEIARKFIRGYLIMGTFSDQGPTQCSGLDIKQYSEETLTREINSGFDKLRCITEDHTTPFNTRQNFLFCSFKRHYN